MAKVKKELKIVDEVTDENVVTVDVTPEDYDATLKGTGQLINSTFSILQAKMNRCGAALAVFEGSVGDTDLEPSAKVVLDYCMGDLKVEADKILAMNTDGEVEATTWLDRLEVEADELGDKIDKLGMVIADELAPEDQLGVLDEQLTSMQEYHMILVNRLDNAKYPVDNDE